MPPAAELETVLRYHERTKHHFHRYAAGPRALEWANQPDPFRRYAGATLLALPRLAPHDEPRSPPYQAIYHPGAVASALLTLASLSRLLEYSLSLTAWKQAGGVRWALRANPSSGNLHPTEGYVLIALPELGGPGLFHYAPSEHALERRAEYAPQAYSRLVRGLPAHSFLVALSSVHWREAWKYGERAFRYCQHDIGHAIGALRIAAATLGWSALVLDDTPDETIARLLGLDRDADFAGVERESAEALLAIWPGTQSEPLPLALEEIAPERWYGTANRLSRDEPVPWNAIDVVAAASRKPVNSAGNSGTRPELAPRVMDPSSGSIAEFPVPEWPTAGEIIHRRRSLLACDAKTALSAACFYRMLERTLWMDALPWPPTIHFALFVHRVEGIEAGLYALARDAAKLELLRASMHRGFEWAQPSGCPQMLALYLLQAGDARELATQVSCQQHIAGDGAFSLGMIAEYQNSLVANGPWFYRRLYWEAGTIGQVLYLEAEAAGVRATGIGCFYDDPVHDVFGFGDLAFQSIYHFTVGGYVDDPRLTTLPPYE
jgi:SagB-type dehydrogenase family enzyme